MSKEFASGTADPRPTASPTPSIATMSEERALRERVKHIAGTETIKSYRVLDLTYTFRDLAFIYALLALAIGLGCYLHSQWGPLGLIGAPIGALVSGIAFNWINVQLHEASHILLIRNKKSNDVYCNVMLGSWGFQDVQTYRATHGMHHAHLHSDRDPDLGIYTTNVGSVRKLLRGILEDLSLLTALGRKRAVDAFIEKHQVPFAGVPHYATAAKIIAQLIVLSAFLYGCGWWGFAYYGGFYAYGLVGVFPVLVRIRTVVQHHDDELTHVPDGTHRSFISRTTVAPLVEFILIGARMDYHFEHHLFPAIPYYNLRKLHETLEKSDLFGEWQDHTGHELRTEDYLKSYTRLAS